MKVGTAVGYAVMGLGVLVPDARAAIYVNGRSTSAHTSSGSDSSAANYWRVTDNVIVLRNKGPYLIHGSGTMPIQCASTVDYVNVTFSNLTVTAKDENYGAFDCGTKKTVHLTLKGTNALTSTAYSTKIHRPGLAVLSGSTLFITNTLRSAKLTCTGAEKAAGIGGGYKQGVVSDSGNDAGTIHIYGGTIVAKGGASGAGIGGGSGGDVTCVRIRGGVVTAMGGGSGGAGIGGGADGNGGYYYQYNGTVVAQRGAVDNLKYPAHDVGRGGSASAKTANRLYVSGGSLTLGDGYATRVASNLTARVYRCRVPGLTPGAAVRFQGLPAAYGQKDLVATPGGFVDLRLPSGAYAFETDTFSYAATIIDKAVTATATAKRKRRGMILILGGATTGVQSVRRRESK